MISQGREEKEQAKWVSNNVSFHVAPQVLMATLPLHSFTAHVVHCSLALQCNGSLETPV